MNDDRRLFIVSFVVDEPPLPNGQQPRAINIPAFVADWETAAECANDYIAAFPTSPEYKQIVAELQARGTSAEPKLQLRSIMIGGTILT